MRINATVQARGEHGAGPRGRIDRARVELLANTLRRCGFEVIRAGRFGVTVEGDAADFERTFGIDPIHAHEAFYKVKGGELEDLVEGIELASQPLSY